MREGRHFGAVITGLLLMFAAGMLCAKNTAKNEKLQAAVEQAMQGRSGALVVAEVGTGDVVAARGMDLAAGRVARPGSTVKPFVLLALLDAGKVDAEQKLICRRVVRIGGVKMDCTHTTAVTELNAEEAIAYSCNSYFAEVATRLSGAELAQALRRAGLDAPSGFVKEEATGHIETARDRELLQLEALGDRGIEVTPLELLAAYRKLALQKRNGAGAGGETSAEGGASPALAGAREGEGKIEKDAAVFAGLEASVAYGMAHAASVEGLRIAGKTGTAGSRENARPHGFFAGYAPAEKPEIVLVVYVEQGRGADAAAAAQSVFAEFAKEGRGK
jgi:cell division protein FtsI/penicillin-binding protein 2